MRMHEALLYLPHMQVDPMLTAACPMCNEPFTLASGVVIQAVNQGEPITAFFCSEVCLLAAVPPRCCGGC